MALRDIQDSKLLQLLRFMPQVILLLLITLLAAMSISFWPLEIFVSFSPQILIVISGMYISLFVLYAYFIIRDGWIGCKTIVGLGDISVLIVSMILTLTVTGISLSKATTTQLSNAPGTTVRISTFNKYFQNDDLITGLNYLRAQKSDIIGLQEIDPQEVAIIAESFNYNNIFITDCDCSADDTEVALLSRFPIIQAQTIFENKNGAIIRAQLDINNVMYPVYVVHLPVPSKPSFYNRRSDAFDRLVTSVSNEPTAPILLGDFNTTLFSPAFSDLQTSLAGRSRSITTRNWPRCSWYKFGEATCTRIDHIFVPSTIPVHQFNVSESVGSDHRIVTATLRLP